MHLMFPILLLTILIFVAAFYVGSWIRARRQRLAYRRQVIANLNRSLDEISRSDFDRITKNPAQSAVTPKRPVLSVVPDCDDEDCVAHSRRSRPDPIVADTTSLVLAARAEAEWDLEASKVIPVLPTDLPVQTAFVPAPVIQSFESFVGGTSYNDSGSSGSWDSGSSSGGGSDGGSSND